MQMKLALTSETFSLIPTHAWYKHNNNSVRIGLISPKRASIPFYFWLT